MKKIPLSQGKFASVDDSDYDELMKWKWCASKIGNTFYARRFSPRDENGRRQAISMHRVIMNTPKGMDTDHISGDGLDNRKANLRACTHGENMVNQGKHLRNTSGYKGVGFHKLRNKWQAQISINSKHVYLGLFTTPELAHEAYREACTKYHGEFANLG